MRSSIEAMISISTGRTDIGPTSERTFGARCVCMWGGGGCTLLRFWSLSELIDKRFGFKVLLYVEPVM